MFGLGIKAMRLLNGDNDFIRLSLRERPFFLDFSESVNKLQIFLQELALFIK